MYKYCLKYPVPSLSDNTGGVSDHTQSLYFAGLLNEQAQPIGHYACSTYEHGGFGNAYNLHRISPYSLIMNWLF